MCGIAGLLNFESEEIAQERIIERMVSPLGHRGPDGWGIYVSPEAALGHARLSVIDIEGGNQPMSSDRFVIAYNGEVYNFIEIRESLEKVGVSFKTSSDTEVVLKAFEVHGLQAFSLFNGQFAILIWDRIKKRMIAARDRFGIRPLYYMNRGGAFYFASEMKAFDSLTDFKREFNLKALFYHGLLWNTIGDETVYKDIKSLPAGTYSVFEQNNENKVTRYYEIGESQGTSPSDFEDAKEIFQELLSDSINLRLRSDTPVGVYLSGGIDSSIVSSLTKQIKQERFKTFSIAFEDSDFDESEFQQAMVESIQSDHYQINVGYNDINENFQHAVFHFERPVFRTAGVPLYLLSKKVKQNKIKVVLTGEGADELLFGYDSFKELKLLEFWSRDTGSKLRPLLIKKLYPHLQHYKNPKQFGLMRMYYENFLKDFDNELVGLNIRAYNNKILLNYLNKDLDFKYEKEEMIEKIRKILPDNYSSWSILQRNQFLEMKTLLSGYLLSSQGDRMSMANGVEGRYPFLDHRIVEFLFYCNDEYKLNGFSQKHILGQAYKERIPEKIIKRPKRPYMSPDLMSFFQKGKLSSQAADFLSAEKISEYGIFDSKQVKRLINKFDGRQIKQIGYRDNMLITFILSSQMAAYFARNPKKIYLNKDNRTVYLSDYKTG